MAFPELPGLLPAQGIWLPVALVSSVRFGFCLSLGDIFGGDQLGGGGSI